ncbi:MAG: DUF6476 family protein [Rhodovarius sp.]|nr:DUF6476 family protein [Rhodovarius sp.]MCX7933519.1 DUF6476 family protein [Rhodovarius sp.]MDW8315949.1 DUF6476 family protein [Rhodovarius sp.]
MQALKALVVGMGVLILAGTVALVVLIVQRAGGARPGPHVTWELPAGNRIQGIAATESRLAIWVEGPEGERILLFDPASGRAAGEIRARP